MKHKKGLNKIFILSIFFIFCLITGYSAFNTNISLKAKGNVKNKILFSDFINDLKLSGDSTLIDDETLDHNIRYSGSDVNNYVCLDNSCNTLYRVIGVFNNVKSSDTSNLETRVKIIMDDIVFDVAFDEDSSVFWNKPATLNTLFNSEVSSNLIGDAVWSLGKCWIGITSSASYSCERNTSTTWTGKVALMYQSDYGFASKSCFQNKKLWQDDSYNDDYRNYECRSTDWLFEYYMYRNEWTLTKGTKSGVVNIVGYGGAVIDNADAVPNYKINFARKASYLKSDVKVLDNGNNGSKEKPYILTE